MRTNRLDALSAKADPLEPIAALVPWESFRADIEAVVLTPKEVKKSKAGRKPIDAIVMFRMLILQSLYNLSDDQAEYQVGDRLCRSLNTIPSDHRSASPHVRFAMATAARSACRVCPSPSRAY